MNQTNNNNNGQEDNQRVSVWYRTALSVALIAGAFWVFICIALIVNYIRQQPVGAEAEPLDSVELLELKLLLAQRPKDEDLTQKIRVMDLHLRQQYFSRQEFNRRGSYLLLGGVIIFLVGLKTAFILRAQVSIPSIDNEDQAVESQMLKIARRSVAGFGLLLFGSILALAVLPGSTLQSLTYAEPGEGPPIDTQDFYPSLEEIGANWSRFRGPGGQGISAYTNIPETWDGPTGENILWKTVIPLPGYNSPIVWGRRVFLSGANEDRREVYCFDTDSGEMLWKKDVIGIPGSTSEGLEISEDTGYAAPTMATDGSRVYAIFANGDLVSFDFEGKQVWAKNLGLPDSTYGYSTSLDMYQNLLLIQFDQGEDDDDQSKLLALDGATGQTIWQKNRPVADSWTSPVTARTDQGLQFITCSNPLVVSYDPLTGKELWSVNCMGSDTAPSPIYSQGLVFVCQPYDQLYAIRVDGSGDVTETHIAWTAEDGIPDICSPVSNGDLIFLLTTDGTLTCYETQTGNKLWEEDLDADFRTSPSVVGDKLYIVSESEDGLSFILKAAREFQEIARAKLGEPSSCCPAFTDGRIYIRGWDNLYCIGEK